MGSICFFIRKYTRLRKKVVLTLLLILFTMNGVFSYGVVNTTKQFSGSQMKTDGYLQRNIGPPPQMMSATTSWPDGSCSPEQTPQNSACFLKLDQTFNIYVNSPEILMCGNGASVNKAFEFGRSAKYKGGTIISVLGKNKNPSSRIFVFTLKVTKVDANDPHFIAQISFNFDASGGDYGGDEMKLGISSEKFVVANNNSINLDQTSTGNPVEQNSAPYYAAKKDITLTNAENGNASDNKTQNNEASPDAPASSARRYSGEGAPTALAGTNPKDVSSIRSNMGDPGGGGSYPQQQAHSGATGVNALKPNSMDEKGSNGKQNSEQSESGNTQGGASVRNAFAAALIGILARLGLGK